MSSEVEQTAVNSNIEVSTSDTDAPSLASSIRDDASLDMNDDKRASPRKPITRTVHLGTGLGQSLECELRDISQTGGRLRFDDPNCAPQEFLIRLNDGVLRWCQVMWRSKTEIGIRFIKTPKSFGKNAIAPNAPLGELIPQSENNAANPTEKEN